LAEEERSGRKDKKERRSSRAEREEEDVPYSSDSVTLGLSRRFDSMHQTDIDAV
jgi:hypothetical protein